MKDNHTWFLDTVSRFKPPNEKSREALNSRQVNMGSHKLTVQPELKDVALKISSILVSFYCSWVFSRGSVRIFVGMSMQNQVEV